jgi:tetratricopeptide (TPR) repeat protein
MQICQLWTATKFTWLEAMAQEALDNFQSAFPDHELHANAQDAFLSAQKKVGGKPPIELAKLVEDQVKGLSKTDPKFGRLTYDAGRSYFAAGVQTRKKPEKEQARAGAERLWEQYLDWLKGQNTLDPAEKTKNEEKMVYVLLSRAQMWLWEPGAAVEKTFSILQQIEEMSTKVPAAKAKGLEVDQVKVKAYLQQGALDKAVNVVEGMLTKAPDSPRTAFELRRVSDFIWTEVSNVKTREKLAPERVTQLLDWGVRYLREWVQLGEKSASAIDSNELNTVGKRMFVLGLLKNGVAQYPGTYYRIDHAKFAFQEPTQLAADIFGKAIANSGNNIDVVNALRYQQGAAFGILQRWKELVDVYQLVVKDDNLLEATEAGGFKIAPPRQGRPFNTEKFLNDYAYALAELARKSTDKAAGTEAQQIASAVIVATEPKGSAEPEFDFWFARYICILAADAIGERTKVQERYLFYTRTDKELDNDKFGFRKKIMDIAARNK